MNAMRSIYKSNLTFKDMLSVQANMLVFLNFPNMLARRVAPDLKYCGNFKAGMLKLGKICAHCVLCE